MKPLKMGEPILGKLQCVTINTVLKVSVRKALNLHCFWLTEHVDLNINSFKSKLPAHVSAVRAT